MNYKPLYLDKGSFGKVQYTWLLQHSDLKQLYEPHRITNAPHEGTCYLYKVNLQNELRTYKMNYKPLFRQRPLDTGISRQLARKETLQWAHNYTKHTVKTIDICCHHTSYITISYIYQHLTIKSTHAFWWLTLIEFMVCKNYT